MAVFLANSGSWPEKHMYANYNGCQMSTLMFWFNKSDFFGQHLSVTTWRHCKL